MIEGYPKEDYRYFYYSPKKQHMAVRRRPNVRYDEIDITHYLPFTEERMSLLCMLYPDLDEYLLNDLFAMWESFKVKYSTDQVFFITTFHGVL